MTDRRFQWAIIFLMTLGIGVLGLMTFVIWNQQGGREQPAGHGSFGQSQMGGGEEGDNTRASGPPEPAQPDRSDGLAPGKTDKEGPETAESTPGRRAGAEKKSKAEPQESKGAPEFQADVAASRVYVRVGSATRIGHEHGVEGRLASGSIRLGAGGELVFDMKSFQADTQEARKKAGLEGKRMSENEGAKVTQTMLGPDVLDVDRFPTATFKIIAIKPAARQEAGAPGPYQVNGRLELHGADQPLRFRSNLARTDKDGVFKLTGSFAIRQSTFGITPYSGAGGIAKVADELEILAELSLGPAK